MYSLLYCLLYWCIGRVYIQTLNIKKAHADIYGEIKPAPSYVVWFVEGIMAWFWPPLVIIQLCSVIINRINKDKNG